MSSRRMVKLIHADDFFPDDEATRLKNVVQGLNFVDLPYGKEIPNFNMIFPECETIFYKVLGERVIVDPQRSGVIRKPNHNAIHFEDFSSTEEWCFIVALENTTVNFWYHIDEKNWIGDFTSVNAKNVFDGFNFNYNNLFEWKIHTNILLEPNQCLFFRPWVFHSLQEGLVQYYRLMADNSYRILVMGLPGSFKSVICEKLHKAIEDSIILNSYAKRQEMNDIDFSQDGQLRHCYRMLNFARQSKAKVTIIDMVCPLPKMREILNPDIIVWASDKDSCQYPELNQMFVPPVLHDIECKDDSDNTIDAIIKRIVSKR